MPTPTAGGIAIVLPACVFLGLSWQDGTPVFLVSLALLAVVGLIDDIREISAAVRFFCQILAVVSVVLWLDPGWQPVLLVGLGFAFLWHINLFNFMDGIDGFAATQALLYFGGTLLIADHSDFWTDTFLWVMLGAVSGFLVFNWPPARIFMGDVGSLFLGLCIPVLATTLWLNSTMPIAGSLILTAVFWFDSSYTLAVRLLSSQNIVEAHKTHLYQRLAARFGHYSTTVGFIVFGAAWLLPLAQVAALVDMGFQLALLGLAILPLAVLALVFKAGVRLEN